MMIIIIIVIIIIIIIIIIVMITIITTVMITYDNNYHYCYDNNYHYHHYYHYCYDDNYHRVFIIAVPLIVNFIIFDFLVNLDKMTHVRVEIKKAGDGINYPQKGRTVTIHYSGHYKIHKILLEKIL